MNPLPSDNRQNLLEQLHDIEGVDPVSIWPLAVGWWVLIGVSILLLILFLRWAIAWIYFKRSWKNDTLQKLALLEKNLSPLTANETLVTLSEYLRRIAIRRFSRKECAGLSGQAWLEWLTLHDPQQFNWKDKGVLLIRIPYAPAAHPQEVAVSQIRELIHAARSFVR